MWSSRARATTLLSLALLAGACTPKLGDIPPSAGPRRLLQDPSGAQPRVDPRHGLLALPSPRQVTNAVSQGRLDPFAPIVPQSPPAAAGGQAAAAGGPVSPAPAAASAAARPGAPATVPAPASPSPSGSGRPVPPAAPTLPSDFAFTGVIASGGRVGALVQIGPNSGTVQLGETGHPSTPWLPQGWRVVGIDGEQPRLTLRRGSTVRSFTLP
jgi:hypothetical protein